MCSAATYLASLLGAFWSWLITFGATVPQVILAISAIYASYFVIKSRLKERTLNNSIANGASEEVTKDLRKEVNNLKDLATLVPNWMLVVVFLALIWRFLYLLRLVFVQICSA